MSNAPTLLKTTNDIQGSIPYTPVKKNNVPYKGQRKLLIMLLDFVNNTHHLSNTIVYAGAADGTNIGVVAELYPKHQFHLYDPRPFNVAPRPNIHIHQGYFTDDDARSYFDKPVLFVSDIRTMNNANFEEAVRFDLDLQKRWVHLMVPAASCLKFRIPYDQQKLNYFDAPIQLQPWTKPQSNECRMWVPGFNAQNQRCLPQDKTYTLQEFEDKMFYYNINNRPTNDRLFECSVVFDYFQTTKESKKFIIKLNQNPTYKLK